MGILDSMKDAFTKSTFEIEDTMTVSQIATQFKKKFGCSLRIYKGSALADGRMTIKTLDEKTSATINKDAGKLKIKATDRVAETENNFKKKFGIKIQIANYDNTKLVPNEITIGEASRM